MEIKRYLVLTFFLLCGLLQAFGQSTQNDEDSSQMDFEAWAKSLSEFVGDVRFNEDDITSMLSLYDDFNRVGGEETGDEEEYVDFASILNDPAYLSWAKSKGLDGKAWLQKTMRIVAVMMQSSIEKSAQEQSEMEAQMQQQLEMMKAQLDEQTFQQMKQEMEAGAATMRSLYDAYKYLPVPDDSEKSLLKKYRKQLRRI